jgi:quercetin dioxygenase-like cupin family protein
LSRNLGSELGGGTSIRSPRFVIWSARMELWQLDDERVEVHSPRVLRSDENANRVILVALPEGERLADHQVHEHALVLVLEGRLLVRAGEEERELGAPGLVHFEPAERHEVIAVVDCRILICLAPWPGAGHPSRSSR